MSRHPCHLQNKGHLPGKLLGTERQTPPDHCSDSLDGLIQLLEHFMFFVLTCSYRNELGALCLCVFPLSAYSSPSFYLSLSTCLSVHDHNHVSAISYQLLTDKLEWVHMLSDMTIFPVSLPFNRTYRITHTKITLGKFGNGVIKQFVQQSSSNSSLL